MPLRAAFCKRKGRMQCLRYMLRLGFAATLALTTIGLALWGLGVRLNVPLPALSLGSRTVEIQAHHFTKGISAALTALPIIPSKELEGEKAGQIAILLVGRSGQGWIAGELTDTLMVLVIDLGRERTHLISIPRDLLVQIPGSQNEARINTLMHIAGARASDTDKGKILEDAVDLKKKVEEITGLSIPYIVVADIAPVETVVSALGGVQVNVEHPIDDPEFPTPGGGVERFTLDAGWRFLDGRAAGKYVRTRHDKDGDFSRMKRQQQVAEAIFTKARGLKLTEDFGEIIALLATIDDHVTTNISMREMKRLWEIRRFLDPANVQSFTLDFHEESVLFEGGTQRVTNEKKHRCKIYAHQKRA